MKVAYYCPPFWGDGGPATHAQGVVKGLRRLGHEVLVLPPAPEGALPLGYRPPRRGVPDSALSVVRTLRACGRSWRGGLARRCVEALREFGPDRLIVRRAPYDLVADAVVRGAGCPVTGEINAVSFWEAETYFGRRYDRLERRRQRLFYVRCDRLACVTEEVKDQLVALGLPEAKMVVVPNGVDTELFNPAVPRAPGVFDALLGARALAHGVGERSVTPGQGPGVEVRPVVGYCASVTPLHDLPVVVAALQGLAEDLAGRVAFLFVGPAQEDLVEAGADPDFLRLCVATGRVPHSQVPRLLAWMDVGCVALRGIHQSPLKVMEFMAMGVPVVAAADGSGLEPLRQAGAGIVTRAGDSERLRHSLRQLLADPATRDRMAAAGPAWVAAFGTWEEAAARMLGTTSQGE
jgi:glycosyltransferase involved in cell wall biosynthesis